MIDYIELQAAMAIDLSAFLWRKYSARLQKFTALKRDYPRAQFADDIKIDPKTLGAWMNNEGATRISFDNYRSLSKAFGHEFTDAFDLTPPERGAFDELPEPSEMEQGD